MSALLIAFGLLTGGISALIIVFKANAGVMFLAACAGLVLLSSIDPTVITAASAFVPSEGEAYVRLAVVVLSFIFAAMMFSKSIKSSQLMLHIPIGLLLALTLLLILPETTGVSWLLSATREQLWRDVNEFRSLVVAAGLALSLLAVLVAKKPNKKKSKH